MNCKLYLVIVCLLFAACNSQSVRTEGSTKVYTDIGSITEESFIIPIYKNESHEVGDSVGFVNKKGDTIVPIGKYSHSWTDTIQPFVIVYDSVYTNSEVVAIDSKENLLFDIYFFDNYPDQLSDGLFRVKRNGKIGYANRMGQIIIPCQYECANSFEGGKAQVAYKCQIINDGEHTIAKSDEWFTIDVNGEKFK